MGARRAGPTARATAARASGKGNGGEGQRQATAGSASNGAAMVLHACTRARSPPSPSGAGYTSRDGDARVGRGPGSAEPAGLFCPRANEGKRQLKSRDAGRPARPSSRVRRIGHPFCPRGAGANSLKSTEVSAVYKAPTTRIAERQHCSCLHVVKHPILGINNCARMVHTIMVCWSPRMAYRVRGLIYACSP